MNFVAANCPQCSGALQVPDDRDIVKCMYCGVDVVVQQAIQLVSGNPKNFLELANNASAAGNYSEAYGYFTKVLEIQPTNAQAWFGKGTAAGWQSSLKGFRFGEMLVAYENAIKFSKTESVGKMKSACGRTLSDVATACHTISRKHAREFIKVPNVWNEHLQRCQEIIAIYEIALQYSPDQRAIIENIITVCKENIEGIKYDELIPGTPYHEPKLAALSPEYEQERREKIIAYARKMQVLDPKYVPPNPQRQAAGCFVVTATLGSENHPDVRFLRLFRDELLVKSAVGTLLVTRYYKYGPVVARRIQNSSCARIVSYLFLVAPAVAAAKVIMRLSKTPIFNRKLRGYDP